MHSFDASTLNFGEVVQHISPLNKHYWHFLIPPSGPTSGSRGHPLVLHKKAFLYLGYLCPKNGITRIAKLTL